MNEDSLSFLFQNKGNFTIKASKIYNGKEVLKGILIQNNQQPIDFAFKMLSLKNFNPKSSLSSQLFNQMTLEYQALEVLNHPNIIRVIAKHFLQGSQ